MAQKTICIAMPVTPAPRTGRRSIGPSATSHASAVRYGAAPPDGPDKDGIRPGERCKAQLRALVAHPFRMVRNLFGYPKLHYRGLAQSTAQLRSLYRARRWELLP